jgi:hypothetical protein
MSGTVHVADPSRGRAVAAGRQNIPVTRLRAARRCTGRHLRTAGQPLGDVDTFDDFDGLSDSTTVGEVDVDVSMTVTDDSETVKRLLLTIMRARRRRYLAGARVVERPQAPLRPDAPLRS